MFTTDVYSLFVLDKAFLASCPLNAGFMARRKWVYKKANSISVCDLTIDWTQLKHEFNSTSSAPGYSKPVSHKYS